MMGPWLWVLLAVLWIPPFAIIGVLMWREWRGK